MRTPLEVKADRQARQKARRNGAGPIVIDDIVRTLIREVVDDLRDAHIHRPA